MNLLLFAMLTMLSGHSPVIPEAATLAIIHNFYPLKKSAYCLTILDRNPSPGLLKKLRKEGFVFIPGSKCDKGKYAFFTPDGRRAQYVSIKSFRYVDEHNATAKYVEVDGPFTGGAGWHMKLFHIYGQWFVVNQKMLWIS